MIAREDYLNALELIDQYHQQLNLSDVRRSSSMNKTLISEWSKIEQCSTKLRNIILGIDRCEDYYDRVLQKKIEYIEDISKRNFMQQYGAGKGSWKEFCDLSGLNYA